MKVYHETVTRREGEYLGFVGEEFELPENIYPCNPETRKNKMKMFLEIQELFQQGKKIRVWYDPMLAGMVMEIGYYDGWPYWKPYPHVRIQHWFGGENHPWHSIYSYEVVEDEENE